MDLNYCNHQLFCLSVSLSKTTATKYNELHLLDVVKSVTAEI